MPMSAGESPSAASSAAAASGPRSPDAALVARYDVSDAALVSSLPGFTSAFAHVNGIRLHYVSGGDGDAVFLLPGWPETWWAYRKIASRLAQTRRVFMIDLRGMGASDRPEGGYDKKTMASDIAELARQTGNRQIDVVGHDIGSMVAFSLAANQPALVRRLLLIEGPHPTAGFTNMRLLPEPGTFNDRIDEEHPYLWWFAFNQVKGMPEELLEGRASIEHSWFFRYMLRDASAINDHARAVYAAAYTSRDANRSANAWYQAFGKDIADASTYAKLEMPVLGLSGVDYPSLKATLDSTASEATTLRVPGSGHFIPEERPDELLAHMREFFG